MSEKTAIERWYERYEQQGRNNDHPRVSVWFPQGMPWARLVTVGRGCNEPDVLPSGPPIVHVTIGGVDIGGPLEDIELLLACAVETVAEARAQYETMRAAENTAAAAVPS